jgi:hypothetical protein
MKLFLAILGVLGPIVGAVALWMGQAAKRERVALLEEIEALNEKARRAAKECDMDALAECHEQLVRLRRKARVSQG